MKAIDEISRDSSLILRATLERGKVNLSKRVGKFDLNSFKQVRADSQEAVQRCVRRRRGAYIPRGTGPAPSKPPEQNQSDKASA